MSERWFGLRTAYYRRKRQRGAKKFTVTMNKQGKEVSPDRDGRYIDPLGTPRSERPELEEPGRFPAPCRHPPVLLG